MLKTFELKAKSLGCRLISRERDGRDRIDVWEHPAGIHILTIHSNEHIRSVVLNPHSFQAELTGEDCMFDQHAFKAILKDFKIGIVEIEHDGQHLAHALMFELRDTWCHTYSPSGIRVTNTQGSGFYVPVIGDVVEDLRVKGIYDRLDHYDKLVLTPDNFKTWSDSRHQFDSAAEDFIHVLQQIGMERDHQAQMQKALSDLIESQGPMKGYNFTGGEVCAVSPEEMFREIMGMGDDVIAQGFTICQDEHGNPITKEVSKEEFFEKVMGIKPEITPESNLPS